MRKTQADDEPLTFSQIVHINGIEDALWCCRAEPQHHQDWRLFAIWCAHQVRYLMKDPSSRQVLDTAERHAIGLATDEELIAARVTRVAANAAGIAARAVVHPVAGVAVWVAANAAANAAGVDAWVDAIAADGTAAAWAATLVVADPAALVVADSAQNGVQQQAAAVWADVLDVVRRRQRVKFLELVEGKL